MIEQDIERLTREIQALRNVSKLQQLQLKEILSAFETMWGQAPAANTKEFPPKLKAPGTPWTEKEIELLETSYREWVAYVAIKLGRTKNAVQAQLGRGNFVWSKWLSGQE